MPGVMKKKVFTQTGNTHFVTFTTFGRRNLLSSPRARQIVMAQLAKLADQDRVRVSGFVVMPDHVHALLWFAGDPDVSGVMRLWKGGSSHWLKEFFNKESPEILDDLCARRGGGEKIVVWQRRFYDFNINTEKKSREKLVYMHFNPVRKGLCERPEDYLWSSARWYLQGRNVGVKICPGL